jgi:hypothetical protein
MKMSAVKVSWRAERAGGHIMILDRDTSDAYIDEDQAVIEEVAQDAQILADQLDTMIEVHVTTPDDHHTHAAFVWPASARTGTTPRTTHMSFAECFAALKLIVGDRADRTIKLEVTVWQHNSIPDTDLSWSAWIGAAGKAIMAPTPESLVARVRAAIDGSDVMTLDEVRT